MKYTTANLKHPNYTANQQIYVGTQIGTLKKITPGIEEKQFEQQNLQDLNVLQKDWCVSALAFSDVEKSEILVGRQHSTVQFYSTKSDALQRELTLESNKIVGLACHNEQLIAGFENGTIQCALLDEQGIKETRSWQGGDHMSHLRQCAQQRNFIATGGKERQNNLKVFDITSTDNKPIFTSKNVPPDYLQLEVPVWDSDVGFMDSPHVLATCSRTGYVRVYDTRKQRRPVQCYMDEKQPKSFAALATHGNYIYSGTTMGQMHAFDMRRLKNFVHTYKGFTGGISDLCLDESGKHLVSSCLDRYVRVHNADSTVLLYQCYIKSQATRVLVSTGAPLIAAVKETLPDKRKNNKQQTDNRQNLTHDAEYENMFEQMPTINEKVESAADTAGEESEEQTEATSIKVKKRKHKTNKKANKRQKNV